MKQVFTIPSGTHFAKTLAAQLLDETQGRPEKLSEYKVLLPTRRACRVLRDAFLQQSGGKPLLLPALQPLGDIDEEELSFSFFGAEEGGPPFDLPPAISPLRRQLLLARLIQGRPDFTQGPDQAIILAGALGLFMDQIIIEELDIGALYELVPEEFADHWQITLTFLQVLSKEWPKILAAEGAIDAAERRRRLMDGLAGHWQKSPPETPVIAAGSTGSIPATARLLDVIAALPQGRVILPGLDKDMDEQSWEKLDESHPQYGLKQLLGHMSLERVQVRTWPEGWENAAPRAFLASEIMRPAETSRAWEDLKRRPETEVALEGVQRFDCENIGEEATLIALLFRETLETKGRTAALVTTDRKLARRVAMACKRWHITVDDSAGQSLDATSLGSFLRLGVQACLENLAPVALLSLLKHDLCALEEQNETLRKVIDKLEIMTLRGLRPAPGFQGLKAKTDAFKDDSIDEIVNRLERFMTRFMALAHDSKPQKFGDFLQEHIAMAESLAGDKNQDGAVRLWAGDAGEAASAFLSELQNHAHFIPPVTGQGYLEILSVLMRGINVRPAYGTHPRLQILGQMEARLIDADLMILGGLNEGSWPPEPGHDPWMSRVMRKDFGLPGSERFTGLAAHDFAEGFCAKQVVLTRSKKTDGAPAVPSRWLQRLDTVLQAAGIAPERLTDAKYFSLVRELDSHETVKPLSRPEPKPPKEKRPRRLPVTRIETWLKDPYSIYARYVLRLRRLDAVDMQPDAKERGNLLHEILRRFVTAYPHDIPDNAQNILIGIGEDVLSESPDEPALWQFWRQRFFNVSTWFLQHERQWRMQTESSRAEIAGAVDIRLSGKAFTLEARADRVDIMKDGSFSIIDYKSGGSYSKKSIETGAQPQLPLEALILTLGGFQDIPPGAVNALAYWKITGGTPPGAVTCLDDGAGAAAARAEAGLKNLVAAFDDDNTPYYSLPVPANAPRFNDYEHLARVKEWAALDDSSEEAA